MASTPDTTLSSLEGNCTETDHLLGHSTCQTGNGHHRLPTLISNDSAASDDYNDDEVYNMDGGTDVFFQIKQAWQDAIQDTQDPDVLLMSMSLTKAASILPSKQEVVQAVEEVEDALLAVPGTPQWNLVPDSVRTPQISHGSPLPRTTAPATTSKRVPLHAFLTLGSAVCALSSIGPFLAAQQNVSPNMKVRTCQNAFRRSQVSRTNVD